jgi:hypothetical protein
VAFIRRGFDRAAIEQAWRAWNLNYTAARKGPPGSKDLSGLAELLDPFPA